MRKNKTYDDRELLLMLRGNKKESSLAFEYLYNRYSQKIYAYCKVVLNGTQATDDVFHDTFVKFYNYVRANDSEIQSIKGYLIMTARNLCLNHKKAKKPKVDLEYIDQEYQDTINYERKDLFDILMKAVDLLDEIYKEAFVLKKIDGFTYKEISEILDITVEGAKSRVTRARAKLNNILKPYIKEIKNI